MINTVLCTPQCVTNFYEAQVYITLCICVCIIIITLLAIGGFILYKYLSDKHTKEMAEMSHAKELLSSNRGRLTDYRKDYLNALKNTDNKKYLDTLNSYIASLDGILKNEADKQK